MKHLGMSEVMFNSMNRKVMGIRTTNQPYVVLAVNIGGDWLYDLIQPKSRKNE